MSNGILGGIPYHSWPCPAHHFAYLLALFRRIAVGRTILAGSLVFTIFAMIQTTTSEICQMLIFLWQCVLMKMMSAIQLCHLSHSLLFSFYPAHPSIVGIPSAVIARGKSISSSSLICSPSHATKPSILLVSILHGSDEAKGSCCCFMMPRIRS